MDLLWAVIYFPVSLITWIISVVWLALAVAGLLAPIADIILDLVLDPAVGQRQGLAHLLGLQPELFWDIGFNLTCGIVFSLTAPAVLRGLAAMQTGLTRAMLSWRSEVSRLQTSRAAVQRAEADTRRRLERDIHDGPQQRLVRLRMDLARAHRQAEKDPAAASAIIQGAMEQTQQTLDELRQLSRGIAPPVLIDRGLAAAITEAATRSSVPVTVSTELSDLPDHVSQAAYFVVSEALANLNKHSGATAAGVEARVADGALLGSMSSMDIATLFGNALDNAIEASRRIDDPAKRLIKLALFRQGQMVVIRIDNWFDGHLNTDAGGRLTTIKQDTVRHGSGVKSIQWTARQYGGQAITQVENHWFTLTVLLPSTTPKEHA